MTAILWRSLWLGMLLCGVLVGETSRVGAQAHLSLSNQAAVGDSDDQLARALFDAACDAYDQGRYEDALRLFEQAYAYSKRPALMFNIGHVADRLRQDTKALASFRAYLEALPEAENRLAVASRIAVLEAKLTKTEAASEKARLEQQQSKAQVVASEHVARAALEHGPNAPRAPKDADVPLRKQWWVWTAASALAIGLGVGLFYAFRPTRTRTEAPFQNPNDLPPLQAP